MDWNDFYGAYIEYEHHGIHSYSKVIVDDWHKVMAELDSFVEESKGVFIDAFGDSINFVELADCYEEFKYLNEEMSPCEAIELVIKNEIKRNNYDLGTLYTSRRYWQFLQWVLEDVWNEEKSYFKIHFEGPLPKFISKWHSYVMESCRVYPQIIEDKSKRRIWASRQPLYLLGPKVYSEDYELLGKLSLFLDVDEKRFPEALRGFFGLVEDYNKKHC